jgi:hypothetical protein
MLLTTLEILGDCFSGLGVEILIWGFVLWVLCHMKTIIVMEKNTRILFTSLIS